MTTKVKYSRRICKNYQSEEASVELEVLDEWHEADVYVLARAMVRAMLSLRQINGSHVNRLLKEYTGDKNADIAEYFVGEGLDMQKVHAGYYTQRLQARKDFED